MREHTSSGFTKQSFEPVRDQAELAHEVRNIRQRHRTDVWETCGRGVLDPEGAPSETGQNRRTGQNRPEPSSVADGGAVFARVGAALQDAAFAVDENRLIAAE